MTTQLRLQTTPEVLTILATNLSSEDWRKKLFQIDSFKERIFQGNQDNPKAEANLRKAALCQKIKQDLLQTQSHFAKDEFEKGKVWFNKAVSNQEFIQDQTDLKVEEIVYKAMWEEVGKPDVANAGKEAFENPTTEVGKKQAALQKSIDAFEAHWSSQVMKDVPKDMFVSEELEKAKQENTSLKTELDELKKKPSFWSSFFKWTGLAAVGLAALGLLSYIFQGPQADKI